MFWRLLVQSDGALRTKARTGMGRARLLLASVVELVIEMDQAIHLQISEYRGAATQCA